MRRPGSSVDVVGSSIRKVVSRVKIRQFQFGLIKQGFHHWTLQKTAHGRRLTCISPFCWDDEVGLVLMNREKIFLSEELYPKESFNSTLVIKNNFMQICCLGKSCSENYICCNYIFCPLPNRLSRVVSFPMKETSDYGSSK